jgi:mRNA-degrading endonuclease YafQ of YafQ-DinJ toxin-antitoxin module
MIKFKQKDLEDKGVDISQDSKFQKAVNDIKNESVGDGQKMLEVIQLVARALEEANQFHRETAANTKKTVEVMQ